MALPFLILSAASRQPALTAGPSLYRPGGAHRAVSAGLALSICGGVGAALILALMVPQLSPSSETLVGKHVPIEAPTIDPSVKPERQRTDQRLVDRTQSIDTAPTSDDQPLAIDRFDTGLSDVEVATGAGQGGGGGGIVQRLPDPPAPLWRPAIRDPRFADRFQPAYPTAMEREGVEGRCPVSVTIAASGRVTAVRDNGCATPEFFRATERQALRHWRFRAATRDGVAVESTQELAITFRIEE